MTKRAFCADCGAELQPSNSERGKGYWCVECGTSRRGEDVDVLYTCCACCGDKFEPWQETAYCDGCLEHGCDDLIDGSLPWCKYKCATTDPPDCDDHSFVPRSFQPGVECRWCGYVTNPNWANQDYGDEWDEIREEAIERDDEQCSSCGLTRSEHREEYSEDLHVHHKEPLRSFESVEEAHQLSNLVTLCKSCHFSKEWELEEATHV